jgi:hypothetical protein
MILNAQQHKAYLKWRKENVSYRGMKEIGQPNYSNPFPDLLGDGLYTAALSNKKMCSAYGDVYIAIYAKPKHPLVFNTLNDWQIWMQQNLLKPFKFNRSEFNKATDIRTEILKMGYDGVIIKGREMVNYTPSDKIIYFKYEWEVEDYWVRNFLENS